MYQARQVVQGQIISVQVLIEASLLLPLLRTMTVLHLDSTLTQTLKAQSQTEVSLLLSLLRTTTVLCLDYRLDHKLDCFSHTFHVTPHRQTGNSIPGVCVLSSLELDKRHVPGQTEVQLSL
jgi:hypothetical protein